MWKREKGNMCAYNIYIDEELRGAEGGFYRKPESTYYCYSTTSHYF